ncbi:MAG: BrnT family toxin [Alphaproteobacteria bacterium]|nr:BrnT family toxin [Alphaproteobacteria bacterium]
MAGKSRRFEAIGGEHRWQTIGLVDGAVFLLVAHSDREEHGIEVVRIISARRATTRERRYYAENRPI